MKMRRILCMTGVVAPGLFALLLAACQNPASVPPVQHTISGVVADIYTGAPIQGATVVMGKYTATTDSSGKYSIALDPGATSVTGAFAVSKGTGYGFEYFQSATLDASADPSSFDVKLTPAVAPAPSATLSGTILDSSGNPSANVSGVYVAVVNQNGGASSGTATYSSPGYSFPTYTTGPDCFVAVAITYTSGAPDVFYLKNQNISPSSSTVNLQVPSSGSTSVTVGSPDATAGAGMAFAVPGYGTVLAYTGSGSSFPTTLTVYDPDNFPVAWGQGVTDMTSSPIIQKFAISAPQSVASSATFPPFALATPSTYDDVTTASSGYSNGTLSFTASSDPTVNVHLVQLIPVDSTGKQITTVSPGVLWMSSGSATLPASIQSIISSELAAATGNSWGILAFAGSDSGLSVAKLFGFGTIFAGSGVLGATDLQLAAAAGANSIATNFIQ